MKKSKLVILIYRFGQLGDTLIAMPAISAIYHKYPGHTLILLTDQHLNNATYVSSWDILGPTNWFEKVVFYNPNLNPLSKLKLTFKLIRELRDLRIDYIFNLSPERSKLASIRDKLFFYFATSPKHYFSSPFFNPPPAINGSLPRVSPEWNKLLALLPDHDYSVSERFALSIPSKERETAYAFCRFEKIDFSTRLIAIGPGSKMSAKRWPKEYFLELGSRIISDFPDFQLLIFGGKEDALLANELCSHWKGKATNLAGRVSIYGAASILEKCDLYVGNDTGTMHLAAMVAVPCVALFSARDYPGKWEPYGEHHIVLRHATACEGCMLNICKYENECLKKISVNEAYSAMASIIKINLGIIPFGNK
jgi:ADP-heptose:LPS heptosyltransferase